MFLVGWIIFIAFASTTFALNLRARRVELNLKSLVTHFFPRGALKDKSTVMDALMYGVSKMTRPVILIGHYSLIVFTSDVLKSALMALYPNTSTDASPISVICIAIIACLVWDFSNFLSHYLQHKVPFLWEIHKVHHSATQLTPFTAKRLHPIADKLDLTIGGLLVGCVFGVAQYYVSLTVPMMILMLGNINMIVTVLALDPLRHSSVGVSFGWLEYLLVSPRMHHLHHSVELKHWDKNMGFAFAVWDQLFHTYMRPEPAEAFQYGIGRGEAEDEKYQNLTGAYIDPVVNAVAVATAGLKPVAVLVKPGIDPVLQERIKRLSSEKVSDTLLGLHGVHQRSEK